MPSEHHVPNYSGQLTFSTKPRRPAHEILSIFQTRRLAQRLTLHPSELKKIRSPLEHMSVHSAKTAKATEGIVHLSQQERWLRTLEEEIELRIVRLLGI